LDIQSLLFKRSLYPCPIGSLNLTSNNDHPRKATKTKFYQLFEILYPLYSEAKPYSIHGIAIYYYYYYYYYYY